MSENSKMFVVCEDHDDEKLLLSQLAEHFNCVALKYSRNIGEQAVDVSACALVLVAVAEIAAAGEALLRVMKALFADAPRIPPFVLMCSTSDSAKACILAQDGIFDDFVIFKPWVDPNQVVFRVGRVLESGTMATSNADFREVAARGARLADPLLELGTAFEAGRQSLIESQSRAMHSTRQSISTGMKQLERDLMGAPAGDAAVPLPAAVQAKLAAFESGQLEGILDRLARENSYAMNAFVERYAQDLEARMAPVREFQERCRAVKPLVAVIDDDASVGETVSGMLEAMGLDTFVVRDPRVALQAMVARRPDLALLDIDMPHVDGFAVLDGIKAHPVLAPLPVIMLTGGASQDNVKESVSRGAVDFIAKPFDFDRLQERVLKALQRS